MTHVISSITVKTDKGDITILGPKVTNKSIRQFKEELLDNLTKEFSFIAFSCDIKYL